MVLVMANETADAAKQLHDELLPNMPTGSHDPAGCPFCSPNSQETAAAGGAGMADNNTVDLNAPEIVAVVNDRVASQTVELRTRAESAEKARDEAQTKIDVLEAEKSAAISRAETAEAAVKTKDEEIANERASAGRRDTRKAALREVAAHLDDKWFEAEVAMGEEKLPRLERIARMTDVEFDSYKGEIASAFEGVTVAPAAGGSTSTSTATPPRETAMAGATNGGGGKEPSASSKYLSGVSAYGRR